MRTAALPALALALLSGGPALASLVDRAGVTLGRLVDDLDLALVVRVEAVEGDTVDLRVLERLRGPRVDDVVRLALPQDVAHDLRARPGERLLVLLALGRPLAHGAGERPGDTHGRPLPPVTVWQAIRASGEQELALLREAVASRAPTIGGDPRALERALFAQLEAGLAGDGDRGGAGQRVRDDAALDLLAFRSLSPGAGEVGALARALEAAPTPELAHLAGRVRAAALVPGLIEAARAAASPDTRRAAAEALQATDPQAGAEALAADVDAADPARAALAVSGLGALTHPRARARVARALDDARAPVRVAALRALGERPDPAALDRLAALAWDGAPADARGALAALARAGAGQALRHVESGHPDGERRALAAALRADPVTLAAQVLAGL